MYMGQKRKGGRVRYLKALERRFKAERILRGQPSLKKCCFVVNAKGQIKPDGGKFVENIYHCGNITLDRLLHILPTMTGTDSISVTQRSLLPVTGLASLWPSHKK